jgi:hypothetical protein
MLLKAAYVLYTGIDYAAVNMVNFIRWYSSSTCNLFSRKFYPNMATTAALMAL